MAIQLGTVAPIGFADFPPSTWLACFRALGCTVVQAYRNQNAQVSLAEMEDYIAVGGMPCDSLHGIFGEIYDPSAVDEPARRFAVDTYRREGELVLALGGSLVVVHCSSIRYQGVSASERARRIAQFRRSIVDLGEHGARIGVRYAFENLPGYHALGSDVAELTAILNDLNAPHTGMCFDTGHALMVSDPARGIRTADGRIIYVHLSDNSGKADEHEMPTTAALDTDAAARALHEVGYRSTIMLEVFYTVDRLKRLIDEGCARRLARIAALADGREPSGQ